MLQLIVCTVDRQTSDPMLILLECTLVGSCLYAILNFKYGTMFLNLFLLMF